MGRRSKRTEMRALFSKASQEVLATEGIGGTTMEKIANHAGLSTSLIHHYFNDKEDLYLEVVHSLFAALPHFEADEKASMPVLIERLLKRPAKQNRTFVKAWVGILSESVRTKSIRLMLQKKVLGNLKFIESLLSEDMSDEQRRHVAAGIVSFIFGALLFDVICPKYSPGFSLPFLSATLNKFDS